MNEEEQSGEPPESDASLTKEDLEAIKLPKKEVNPQVDTLRALPEPVPDPKRQEEPHSPPSNTPISQPMSVRDWLAAMGWKANPFIFNINPSLIVGYSQQKNHISMWLEERHKFMLILGPTGSGKTTLLKWLESRINTDVLYIGKPPQTPEEFVMIFNEKFRRPWYAFWKNRLE